MSNLALMLTQTRGSESSDVAKFVMVLMHSRTSAHLMHLQTKSYAQHMALGSFYEGIGDLVDSFVEAYQGLHGVIDSYPSGYTVPSKEPVTELQSLSDTVKSMRKGLVTEGQLQNIIDEIASLIDSTIYKLKNLK